MSHNALPASSPKPPTSHSSSHTTHQIIYNNININNQQHNNLTAASVGVGPLPVTHQSLSRHHNHAHGSSIAHTTHNITNKHHNINVNAVNANINISQQLTQSVDNSEYNVHTHSHNHSHNHSHSHPAHAAHGTHPSFNHGQNMSYSKFGMGAEGKLGPDAASGFASNKSMSGSFMNNMGEAEGFRSDKFVDLEGIDSTVFYGRLSNF